MTDFGQLIRSRRLDEGKTLEEKADEIGVTVGALQRAEKGVVPIPANAKKIAEHHGKTVTEAWPPKPQEAAA